MPVGIGKLSNLQTFNLFTVGKPDSESGYGGISELQRLNQLRGELEIQGLENVRSSREASQANLTSKYYITKLKLSWGYVRSLRDSNTNNVLEDLQLPPNIHQLIINEYSWKTFPKGFLGNLNCLQAVQISNCKELVSLPEGLQKLTSLTELRIEGCNNMKSLPVMGIPGLNASLVSLEIESCDILTFVSKGLTYLTSLTKLSFQHCPELELARGRFSAPHFPPIFTNQMAT